MRRFAGVAAGALCLFLAAPLAARQRFGVRSPERVQVANRQLTLMGMGLRKKSFFKVYLASLYLEQPTTDADRAIERDMVKRVELHLLRGVDKGTIRGAIREGFARNAQQQMPELEERLRQFEEAIPDLREGDKLSFTYVPGTGTIVVPPDGRERPPIPGKDFADALFSVWLGRNPVDGQLKAEMLIGADRDQ